MDYGVEEPWINGVFDVIYLCALIIGPVLLVLL